MENTFNKEKSIKIAIPRLIIEQHEKIVYLPFLS